MKYCLDANVFIESHRRYYAFDIAPPFWDALAGWGVEQILCGTRAVYEDLVKDDDELSHWVKSDGKALFLDPDPATYQCFGEIGDLVASDYEPQLVSAFLGCSDPWVIACAKANGLIVVTMETLRQEVPKKGGKIGGRKIQIPNVCQKVGVSFIDTFVLLRDLKFSFR